MTELAEQRDYAHDKQEEKMAVLATQYALAQRTIYDLRSELQRLRETTKAQEEKIGWMRDGCAAMEARIVALLTHNSRLLDENRAHQAALDEGLEACVKEREAWQATVVRVERERDGWWERAQSAESRIGIQKETMGGLGTTITTLTQQSENDASRIQDLLNYNAHLLARLETAQAEYARERQAWHAAMAALEERYAQRGTPILVPLEKAEE